MGIDTRSTIVWLPMGAAVAFALASLVGLL